MTSLDLPTPPTAPEQAQKTPFLHPLSGLAVLALDWLIFAETALTLGLALPITAATGFVLATAATYYIQKRYVPAESQRQRILKALLCGFIVGLPFPIAGTVFAGTVMGISGLSALKNRLTKTIMSK